MPQIMRYRTGSPADRRQPFGCEQFLLRAMQAGAHPIECRWQFGNFITFTARQWVSEIAGAERLNTGYEVGQRPRKCIRNEKDDGASSQYRDETKCQQTPVQRVQE